MITEEREEKIYQDAEERATDDADSLYPLAEESEAVLLKRGQRIAREYGLVDAEAALFASAYASLYMAEIDCLDQDHEPQDEAERGFIAARRVRLADRDPLAVFRLSTPLTESAYPSYRLARCAYNAARRAHGSAFLSLIRYMDSEQSRERDRYPLLACGSFKERARA